MNIDDHNYYRLEITDSNDYAHLDVEYKFFVGGVADGLNVMPGSVATQSPYIGCVRDILLHSQLVDFNNVERSAGMEKGVCRSEIATEAEGKLIIICTANSSTYI